MTTPDPQVPRSEAESRKIRMRRGPWAMLAMWLAVIVVLFLVGMFARWLY
ncbi:MULTISPECIES: hypothetical protein [Achromobacter]|uniref:Uncharacterized protein n=1 Tax=Achromobacter denitrificans TaxID=32002 RepID=A0A6N0JGI8_ACHDE|nr:MULTISPECIES: hypothetical protein [Achromobacter]QKQ46199.1 hypothetical protein FOC81_05660 [Achromobacter denitrificans]